MIQGRVLTLGSVVIVSLILILVVNLPDRPDAVTAAAFFRLPLEWPMTLLLLLSGPAITRQLSAWLAGLSIAVVLVLKLADLGVQSAFQRPFNPYLDHRLLRNVASGALGLPLALLAVAAALAILGLVVALAILAARRLSTLSSPLRRPLAMGAGALALLGLFGLALPLPIVEARMPAYLAERLALMVRSAEDMRRFEGELAAGVGPASGTGLFTGLAGKDVILVFVESYGRSALEDPRYRDRMGKRLSAVETELSEAGLASASAWVTSPTVGGLSWLAHGTLLSGLWIDSQTRYERLIRSAQPSLNRLFAEAGWQSVAVMPAITQAWPEAAYFGYRRAWTAGDLGYRGKPFNWVTMPDQFTLSAFERLVRRPAQAAGQRVMAELALVSSHAPWTPVPRLIDWAAIGDGLIFDEQATSGPSPTEVWADPERVRQHYIATIDYSLETLGSYMARFGKDAVFLVLGDHQPAAIVTGPDASRAVPFSIITADRALLDRFRADGFEPGLRPSPTAREWRMDALRQLLIDRFSAAP
ncbi:sulfatase [Rhizobium sp. YIM 134829]|uniref:sulfatase n=1 Tax=Rhizobium sp. YIM 134829 TaxID=3390453 RepID=UPI00397ABCEB